MAALPLQTLISQNSTFQKGFRSRTMRLGDGFAHRGPDGLNPVEWHGTIIYQNMNATDFATLIAFIDGIGSWGTFDYQPPGATSTSKFSIDPSGPSISISAGNVYSVSFQCRNEWDI